MSTPLCVEPRELAAISRLVIVDVRSREEFEHDHVRGAINIPLDELERRAAELPRRATIVTTCGKGGGRSERAAELLRARGFRFVRSLCGGTQGWMLWEAESAS